MDSRTREEVRAQFHQPAQRLLRLLGRRLRPASLPPERHGRLVNCARPPMINVFAQDLRAE